MCGPPSANIGIVLSLSCRQVAVPCSATSRERHPTNHEALGLLAFVALEPVGKLVTLPLLVPAILRLLSFFWSQL